MGDSKGCILSFQFHVFEPFFSNNTPFTIHIRRIHKVLIIKIRAIAMDLLTIIKSEKE